MEMKSGIVEVLMHGEPVGVLVNGKKTGSATFRYYDSAPYDLSLSLPRSQKTFTVDQTRNWFEGLLPDPEGYRLEALSKHFILTTVDYTGLLSEVGYESAGAVTFGAPSDDSSPYTGTDLAEILPALPAIHEGASNSSLRSTLSGTQNKIAATNVGSKWLVPDAGLLTSHIIKPENPRWKGMVDAEAWAMELASHAAKAADTSVIEVAGVRALASLRFDRFSYDSELHAVHQEDMCQALGVNLKHRYAVVGGNKKVMPSFKKLADLLINHAENPDHELEELVRQMTITMLLGNTDAHAKNFGLIHDLYSRVSLSPMYDIVPVIHFIPSDTKLAMTINSKFRIDRVRFYDLVQEAVSWGMDDAKADALVRATVDAVADAIPAAEAKYPGRPDGVLTMLKGHLMRFDIYLDEDGNR